ncbi:MAG: DUF373 family protein, partial [Halobacteriaceae archaeon]
ERARGGLYAGRVTLITYVAAATLLVVGGVEAVEELAAVRATHPDPQAGTVLAALVNGAVTWFAAAGVTSSLGQITDEYLDDRFEWRYCNAPFYVVAIATVLWGTSQFFLGRATLPFLAVTLTAGTLLGVLSTLSFAVVETYRESPGEARAA